MLPSNKKLGDGVALALQVRSILQGKKSSPQWGLGSERRGRDVNKEAGTVRIETLCLLNPAQFSPML
jgi:hypothetical protein